MSEPSLAVTLTADDTWSELYWKRLSYVLAGQDTAWDAWKTWANASGSADQKWFAERYSGYVLGYQYQNT